MNAAMVGVHAGQRQRFRKRLLERLVPRSGGIVDHAGDARRDPVRQLEEPRGVVGEPSGAPRGKFVDVEIRFRDVDAHRGGRVIVHAFPSSCACRSSLDAHVSISGQVGKDGGDQTMTRPSRPAGLRGPPPPALRRQGSGRRGAGPFPKIQFRRVGRRNGSTAGFYRSDKRARPPWAGVHAPRRGDPRAVRVAGGDRDRQRARTETSNVPAPTLRCWWRPLPSAWSFSMPARPARCR